MHLTSPSETELSTLLNGLPPHLILKSSLLLENKNLKEKLSPVWESRRKPGRFFKTKNLALTLAKPIKLTRMGMEEAQPRDRGLAWSGLQAHRLSLCFLKEVKRSIPQREGQSKGGHILSHLPHSTTFFLQLAAQVWATRPWAPERVITPWFFSYPPWKGWASPDDSDSKNLLPSGLQVWDAKVNFELSN